MAFKLASDPIKCRSVDKSIATEDRDIKEILINEVFLKLSVFNL